MSPAAAWGWMWCAGTSRSSAAASRSARRPGAARRFLLKLPLTLAIIDGLVVGVGQERYIVPLFRRSRDVPPDRRRPSGPCSSAPRWRWCAARCCRSSGCTGGFRCTPRSEDPLQSVLVVAEVEGQRFCLLVDELIGKQEVVIKSLGETFKNMSRESPEEPFWATAGSG